MANNETKDNQVEVAEEIDTEDMDSYQYASGFEDGYSQAIHDFLNDECFIPIIVQAREWYDKKGNNAHR
jgi:hypothetical protein